MCVHQRAGPDCEIASLASVIDCSYEESADIFGVPLDRTGRPKLEAGVDLVDAVYPLLKRGWLAVPLIAKENPKVSDPGRLPSSDQVKSVLQGRLAIIGYTDNDPRVGDHALAWKRDHAIDCSNGEFVSLDDITLHGAFILARDVEGLPADM